MIQANFRQVPTNIWNPMQQALSGVGRQLKDYQSREDKLARDKAAIVQQGLVNDRADARLGIAQAQEASRVKGIADKEKYDAEVSRLLGNIPETGDNTTSTTKTIVTKPAIVGSTGNADEIAAINRANAFGDLRKQTLEGGKFSPTTSKPVNRISEGTTPQGLMSVVDANGKRMLNTLSVPNAFDTIGSFVGDSVNNLFGTSIGVPAEPNTIGTVHNPAAPAIGSVSNVPSSATQASLIKDKEKYIADEVSNIIANRQQVPELKLPTKAVAAETKKVTKEITEQVKLTPEAQMSNLRNSILNSNLPGSYKVDTLSNIDKMFPKGKEISVSEQLQIARLNNDIAKQNSNAIKDASTLNDIKKMYPGIPGSVKSLDAAKLWVNKISKAKANKTPFVSGMYDTLTTKDTGDVVALDKWLVKNESYLNGLSKGQKSTLLSRMKAGYNNESSNDLSDYLGGDSFTDMVESLGIEQLK